jgi:hypothetical protein
MSKEASPNHSTSHDKISELSKPTFIYVLPKTPRLNANRDGLSELGPHDRTHSNTRPSVAVTPVLDPLREPVVFATKLPLERPMRIILDRFIHLTLVGDARAYGDSGEKPLEHHSPGAAGILQELGEDHQVLQVILVNSNASSPTEVVLVVALASRPLDRAVHASETVLLPAEHPIYVAAEKPLDPLVIKEVFAGKASAESNRASVGFSVRLPATIDDMMVEGDLDNAEGVGKVDSDEEVCNSCGGGVRILGVQNTDSVRDPTADGFVDTRIEQEVKRRLTNDGANCVGSDSDRSGLVALLVLRTETLIEVAMPDFLGVSPGGNALEVEVRNGNLRVASFVHSHGGWRKVSPVRLASTRPKDISPNGHVDDCDQMKNDNRLLEKVREQGTVKMYVAVEEAEFGPVEVDILKDVFLSKSVHALFEDVGRLLTDLPSSPSTGTFIRL